MFTMTIRIKGVKWQESVKVISNKRGVILQVMTKAGRIFRSTSFKLTKEEAARLSDELRRKSI